jgi:hypothetical protein
MPYATPPVAHVAPAGHLDRAIVREIADFSSWR